jgi:hypothetical protein
MKTVDELPGAGRRTCAMRPVNPVRSFLVDDRPAPFAGVHLPDMSLSSARNGMVQHSFALTLDVEVVADLASPAYSAWIEASRRDDAVCGGPQDALGHAGYPDIRAVLQAPELAELVLGHYLLREVLGEFTSNAGAQPEYWLDEVTHCEVEGEGELVRLLGRCYSAAPEAPRR